MAHIQDLRHWDVHNWCYTIPDAEYMFSAETDDENCNSCQEQPHIGKVWTFDVLYRPKRPEYGFQPEWGTRTSEPVKELHAKAEFYLCQKCLKRVHTISSRSSFVSCGKDWWDFVDGLMTDDKYWPTRTADKATRLTNEIMNTLSIGTVKEGTVLKDMPHDILTIMAPMVFEGMRDKLASKIQAVWRGYYQRKYPQHLRYKTWNECEDCGCKRLTSGLMKTYACADQGDCCSKWVCRGSCKVFCGGCDEMMFVGRCNYGDDGEQSYYNCHFCDFQNKLEEEWWGMSITAYIDRYG